jgi:hypothetical protein
MWQISSFLNWHWRLQQCFLLIFMEFLEHIPVPGRSCPLYLQLYHLLQQERCELIWHQLPLVFICNILSLTNSPRSTADMILLCTKIQYQIHDPHSPLRRRMRILLLFRSTPLPPASSTPTINKKQTPWPLLLKPTIPTDRLPLIDEI